MAESVFGIRARGSTIGRELRGGLVTFVTMSYIVVLNPLILGSFAASGPGAKRDVLGAVLPVPQVAAVTALVAGVMTLLFGVVADYPFAMPPGWVSTRSWRSLSRRRSVGLKRWDWWWSMG
jgi:AGZA family xanthine/uracil permease-like MFS transporter